MRNKGTNRTVIFCALLVALSLLPRVWMLQTELWYDEILSLELIHRASSIVGIFTEIHHGNSHYLNTVYMYLLGPNASYSAYHFIPFFFGALLLLLLWKIGASKSPVHSIMLLIAGGFSYYLFLFGWMARGYGPMLFFGLLAYYVLLQHLQKPRVKYLVLCNVFLCMALLFHLVALHFLLGFSLWVVALHWQKDGICSASKKACIWFGPTIVFLSLLYWLDIRGLELAPGTSTPLETVFIDMVTTSVGYPLFGNIGVLITSLALICVVMYLESKPRGALLYTIMLLPVPIIALVALHPPFVYPRYFLPNILFFLLLYAEIWTVLYEKGGIARCMSVLLVALYCIGNTLNIGRHLTLVYRGHSPSLLYIAERSISNPATVGSTSDFHNTSNVQFFANRLPNSYSYVPSSEALQSPPEWFLRDKSTFETVEELVFLAYERKYCLEKHLPQYGYRWAVYRICSTV